MKVLFYGKKNQPVVKFIDKLPVQDQAKIIACLKSVEELGFESPRVEFRQISGKLWEIKMNKVKGEILKLLNSSKNIEEFKRSIETLTNQGRITAKQEKDLFCYTKCQQYNPYDLAIHVQELSIQRDHENIVQVFPRRN